MTKDERREAARSTYGSIPKVKALKPFEPLKLDGLPSDDMQFSAEGFKK
jgi:hypothetical protein